MLQSYKDKLIDFEVRPPLAAWHYISEELKTNKGLLSTSNKLFHYEVTPPSVAWNDIVESLKTENITQQKLSEKKRRARAFSFILAAAVMLGIIVIGILRSDNADLFKNNLATRNTTRFSVKKSEPATSVISAKPSIALAIPKEEAPPPIIIKSKRNYKETSKVLHNTIVKNPLSSTKELQIMISAKPIRNANGEIIQNARLIDNSNAKYISITGPNGQQTKISSKFLDMLLFINTDSDIDEVEGYFDKNFLESLIWKSRFKDWRSEIMNTSLVPSSANFMDILDLRDLIMKDK